MLSIYNKTSLICPTKILEEILSTQSDRDVELIITDNQEIKELNKRFRNKNTHTDVLSFPMEPSPMAPLGSIVISSDYVKNKALQHNHSQENELTLLFIHALLHLKGFDHENDNGEMRDKEEEIIRQFKLPDSLIVRNTHKD